MQSFNDTETVATSATNTLARIALRLGLLLTVLSSPSTAYSSDIAQDDAAETFTQTSDYHTAISDIESSEGAYSSNLPELLLGLGSSLQSQGKHVEAIKVLKRAVHLARVDQGLYSPLQIPALQHEIRSHIALRDYVRADDRQHYLYRVQGRDSAGGLALVNAHIDQADWQFQVYQLAIEAAPYTRLMKMSNLYDAAFVGLTEVEGENAMALLPLLTKMLRTQYLIHEHRIPEASIRSEEDVQVNQSERHFVPYQAKSYKRGQAVLGRALTLKGDSEADDLVHRARILADLGDWHLWHGYRDTALAAYQSAIMELAQHADAKVHTQALFGEPIALPNVPGLRPLAKAVDEESADILLEFDVTTRGRASKIRRVLDDKVMDSQANKLIRKLRLTKFRPRLAGGVPIETQNVIRGFRAQ